MPSEPEDVRGRTKAFALRRIRMFAALPKNPEASMLAKQVVRSGTAIGANEREAYRARSKAEFIAKCCDCLKEAEATAYWLELRVDTDIVAAGRLHGLQDEAQQLVAIFVSSIKRFKGVHESNEPYSIAGEDNA